MAKVILLIILIAAVVTIAACSTSERQKNKSYTASYNAKLTTPSPTNLAPDLAQAEAVIERFTELFSDVHAPDLADKLKTVYAEKLYFNDTMHQFDNREQLTQYMLKLGDQVKKLTVEKEEILIGKRDIWLHWRMTFDLEIMGSHKSISSYGVSQFRLDAEGKINFHQDFWDANNGLYRSLPYVGGVQTMLSPFMVH